MKLINILMILFSLVALGLNGIIGYFCFLENYYCYSLVCLVCGIVAIVCCLGNVVELKNELKRS